MNTPRVVIVGGGFAGLEAAKALRKSQAKVILVDRTNHHLFQPLLYQVATSVLAPAQIATPIRGVLRRQRNATVVLGEVTGVDTAARQVLVDTADRKAVPVAYDFLVLATGVRHSYFGHDEFEEFAPGLKSLADAVGLRNRILKAFERAEVEEDPQARRQQLTFVLVGAGPTGVEMAGAIAVLVGAMRPEFRRIDAGDVRIVLVDMAQRVLGNFAEELSIAAQARLEQLGIELRLGHGAERIDEQGVVVGGERIGAGTVIWTAGVAPSPAGKWLQAATDRTGRVLVGADLAVPGRPEVYVVGDTASVQQDGKPLPGLAQVALQQGRHAGIAIARRIAGEAPPPPFRYVDRGSMAVAGQGFAILETAGRRTSGGLTWVLWLAVHLWALARPGMRVSVFVQWLWTLLTSQRGSRLIVDYGSPHRYSVHAD
jgi:NADH dehydrogenase FAD-containing subunit